MDAMFECKVCLLLPVRAIGQDAPASSLVAEYSFDPDLQPEDVVSINETAFTKNRVEVDGKRLEAGGPKFSFDAKVLNRKKVISPGVEDKFSLIIELEIADQAIIPAIISHFEEAFPGEYEACPPATFVEW